MSASATAFPEYGVRRDWPGYLPAERFLDISIARSIGADKQKIFQALTLPEYMETWLSIPGVSPGCAQVSSLEDSFLITCSAGESSVFHILCTYKVSRRSKIVFTWSRPNLVVPGLVKIRLLGDFERTTVQVTHSGLHPSEMSWHEQLWEDSLEKLAILF